MSEIAKALLACSVDEDSALAAYASEYARARRNFSKKDN
jgi:hypothetical protein